MAKKKKISPIKRLVTEENLSRWIINSFEGQKWSRISSRKDLLEIDNENRPWAGYIQLILIRSKNKVFCVYSNSRKTQMYICGKRDRKSPVEIKTVLVNIPKTLKSIGKRKKIYVAHYTDEISSLRKKAHV